MQLQLPHLATSLAEVIFELFMKLYGSDVLNMDFLFRIEEY